MTPTGRVGWGGRMAASDDRAAAWGQRLIEIHDWLREELARVREELATGPSRLETDVRAHCAAFCSTVHQHHAGEDGMVFPALAEHAPELRGTLAKLAEDHLLIADVLTRLDALLTTTSPDAGADELAHVRAEVDGLAAILESHLAYEERTIIEALDALPPDALPVPGRG